MEYLENVYISQNSIPLMLDVYTPDNSSINKPVFMFIHGGGLMEGQSKNQKLWQWLITTLPEVRSLFL